MPIEDLILYQKMYDLILYAFPILAKYPRDQKWVLAQDIQKSMFDFQKYINIAQRNFRRREMLEKANAELEIIRSKIRLSKDMELINIQRYGVFCKKLEEIGKIFGGYAKS